MLLSPQRSPRPPTSPTLRVGLTGRGTSDETERALFGVVVGAWYMVSVAASNTSLTDGHTAAGAVRWRCGCRHAPTALVTAAARKKRNSKRSRSPATEIIVVNVAIFVVVTLVLVSVGVMRMCVREDDQGRQCGGEQFDVRNLPRICWETRAVKHNILST